MDRDLKSATPGDSSPLTTSSESETFETWTVISDKQKDLTPHEITFSPPTPEKTDDDEDIAIDTVRVEVLKASDDSSENRYTDLDDLSDGISIISECESTGRISPHPELRKHLSDLNMRFLTVKEPKFLSATTESSSNNHELSAEPSSDAFHRMEPVLDRSRRPQKSSLHAAETYEIQPTLRYGIRGLFYIGALLGILAFLSKLKYDAWESVLDTNTGLLTEKINDLELKNNLMRAEIDILTKQVNYLTALSETQKYTASSTKPKNSQQRDKKLKVWPGNGNTIEEIEISKKDMKTPFKCNGHNNVDIAGMCIELPSSKESLVDSFGNKVRSVIDENEHFSNLEKVVDKIGKFAANPFEDLIEPAEEEVRPPQENVPEQSQSKNDYVPHEHKADQYDSKKYDKPESYKKPNPKYENDEIKMKSKTHREKSDDNGSGEKFKKSKDYKKFDKSDEDFNGSGEKYKKSKDFKKFDESDEDSHGSWEKYKKSKDFKKFDKSSEDFKGPEEKYIKIKDSKKYDKYSSMEYEKAKRDSDGQWHEKLMQHRENSRKNNDKYRQDKNWYMERADSREQARVTEQKYR